jgi:mRNA-degrading endonuclease RelE of RelBE toxin-antitoxin system
MARRVIIGSRAEKDLSALAATDKTAVLDALERMQTDLASADVPELGGRTGEWRLRVGRWRAIFELDQPAGVMIHVTRVLPRDRTYRD